MNNSVKLHPADVGFPSENMYLYTSSMDPVPFSENASLSITNECSMLSFCLYYTTQKLKMGANDVYLLGEMTKWIPFSNGRIETIEPRSEDLLITLKGAIYEEVEFTSIISGKRQMMKCNLGDGGRAVLSLSAGSCTPE